MSVKLLRWKSGVLFVEKRKDPPDENIPPIASIEAARRDSMFVLLNVRLVGGSLLYYRVLAQDGQVFWTSGQAFEEVAP